MTDHYTDQMKKLAEVGASLCCYAPGAGDPEKWPTSHCDCKYLPSDLRQLLAVGAVLPGYRVTSEATGCCEVRHAWRVLAMLREQGRFLQKNTECDET